MISGRISDITARTLLVCPKRFIIILQGMYLRYTFACLHYAGFLTKVIIWLLKYGSRKKISFWCRCSTFLSPTFVEIKNSFTRTLLTFNSKNFGIIFYGKNTDENEPI